jgi:hypothetical protein
MSVKIMSRVWGLPDKVGGVHFRMSHMAVLVALALDAQAAGREPGRPRRKVTRQTAPATSG